MLFFFFCNAYKCFFKIFGGFEKYSRFEKNSNVGMHPSGIMYTLCVGALLLGLVSEQCARGNPAKMLQLTAEGFKEHVQNGKTSLIYFGKYGEVSCTVHYH